MGLKQSSGSELGGLLRASRTSFLYVGLFSLFINLMALVPSLYMLQVYDRVVAGRSESTLLMLTLILVGMFVVMGTLELLRSRILARVGARMEMAMQARLVDVMFRHALLNPRNASTEVMSDFNSIRGFVASPGIFAFFDAPWFPLYLGMMFLFHPAYGWFAVGAGILTLLLAVWVDRSSMPMLKSSHNKEVKARMILERSLRNAEVAAAMGIKQGILKRWTAEHNDAAYSKGEATDRVSMLSTVSKSLRMLNQSLILGLGAWLVISGEMSGGMMIAGSILLGRALAPLDQLVGAWKQFAGARQSWERLTKMLEVYPVPKQYMDLPAPVGKLDVNYLTVVPPGGKKAVLQTVTFALKQGESLAIIGPSGAGKSSLVRALLGLWPWTGGEVRLDGADIRQWDTARLGMYVGYLPQDVELFDGTVAENIARFAEVEPDKVLEAAQMAGVHDLILKLPNAYDTVIGPGSGELSGGQRQRIGLARALYGSPALVVLDEPNSNLDEAGEHALYLALEKLKSKGTTVLIISHRPGILGRVDKIMVLVQASVSLFGERQQVLAKLAAKTAQLPTREREAGA